MPRLFIAVWPPPEVVELLRGLPRDDESGVRWTRPDQWHATLRFLGDVDEAAAIVALEGVQAAPAVAGLGPRIERLGDRVLVAPVTGLDSLATAVRSATAHLGESVDPRPFVGHLTVARLGAGGSGLEGHAVAAEFPVDEIALVRSERSAEGARYSTVTAARLAA